MTQLAVLLISGCVQLIELLWLPVLSNVAPPSLHHKAATDNWDIGTICLTLSFQA